MDASNPKRLYFETYLQLLRSAVGTEMFRNFYIEYPERGKADALGDGSNSCAFFVSGVLVMFGKIKTLHGLVSSTVKDMEESGWLKVQDAQAGDVIQWASIGFEDGPHEHIGFALGNGRAVSTSWTEKKVIEHDLNFGDLNRAVKQIFRAPEWD